MIYPKAPGEQAGLGTRGKGEREEESGRKGEWERGRDKKRSGKRRRGERSKGEGVKLIKSHRELEVYQMAFNAAMEIFNLTKKFPAEERFSLTDQIRRSSRSVCSNISEAFRKRRYPKSFVLKLSDAESEAAETQSWLEFAFACKYIDENDFKRLYETYDNILGKLVRMMNQPGKWSI